MSQFEDPDGAPRPLEDEAGAVPPEAGAEPGAWSDLPEGAPAPEPAVDPDYQVAEPQEQLEKSVVAFWLLQGVLNWFFLALLMGGGAVFAAVQWEEYQHWILAPVCTFLGFILVINLVTPYLAWQRWRFYVDGELLLARYGILWIVEKAIPISRLQHVDLYRGFLERIFGLTTLIVFTAGTEGAHFRLPGLSLTRAQQLRDQILAARGDDVI